MPCDPDDLAVLLEHRLREAIDSGHPPVSVAAWRAAVERQELDNERQHPGFVARAAAGLRVRPDGRKITYWREVRGSHGMDWVYDPDGADVPPTGYSLPIARALWDARQAAARRRR